MLLPISKICLFLSVIGTCACILCAYTCTQTCMHTLWHLNTHILIRCRSKASPCTSYGGHWMSQDLKVISEPSHYPGCLSCHHPEQWLGFQTMGSLCGSWLSLCRTLRVSLTSAAHPPEGVGQPAGHGLWFRLRESWPRSWSVMVDRAPSVPGSSCNSG